MGCDIHAHFEIKIDNEWIHYSSPKIYRDYDLFYRMAGVRGGEDSEIKPISLPRGLPKNASKTTRLESEWWGSDGHSHSSLSAGEINKILSMFNEPSTWGYLHGKSWEGFEQYREDYPKEIQDIRLIFWFDG